AVALALFTIPMVMEAAEKEPPERHQRKHRDPFDAGHDWLQFNDPPDATIGVAQRSVTAANVSRLRVVWRMKLPELTDGSAVYLSSVETEWGMRDLVIVLTTSGRLVALDADSGVLIWQTTPPDGPRW